jgi:hypothetical protein
VEAGGIIAIQPCPASADTASIAQRATHLFDQLVRAGA